MDCQTLEEAGQLSEVAGSTCWWWGSCDKSRGDTTCKRSGLKGRCVCNNDFLDNGHGMCAPPDSFVYGCTTTVTTTTVTTMTTTTTTCLTVAGAGRNGDVGILCGL